jgi:hypothetical protein
LADGPARRRLPCPQRPVTGQDRWEEDGGYSPVHARRGDRSAARRRRSGAADGRSRLGRIPVRDRRHLARSDRGLDVCHGNQNRSAVRRRQLLRCTGCGGRSNTWPDRHEAFRRGSDVRRLGPWDPHEMPALTRRGRLDSAQLPDYSSTETGLPQHLSKGPRSEAHHEPR